MTTEEGNKLIAEFDGYEYIDSDKSYDSWGWWEKDKFNDNAKNNPNFLCISNSGLKYHSSWDWLMPVALKIGETCIDNEFVEITLKSDNTCIIDCSGQYYTEQSEGTLLLSTFNAIVNFIQWYNQNKESL